MSGLIIGFRPEFTRIGLGTPLGRIGAKAALMLSQAMWLTENRSDDDGWFAYTLDDWFHSTGLSDEEQAGARRALKKHGIWMEDDRGVEVVINGRKRRTGGQKHYRVDLYALAVALNHLVENDPRNLNKSTYAVDESSEDDNDFTQKHDSAKAGITRRGKKKVEKPEGSFRKQRKHDSEKTGDMIPDSTEPLSYIKDEVKNKHQQQPLAAEMSVADENFSNSGLAPSAPTPEIEIPQQTIKAKLLDFAGKRSIKITSDEIDALVRKWPAAKLTDAELVGALVGDYELYSLDKPADENIARGAVKADASRLRWFMCAWPGFEEAGDPYHEKTKHRWTKTSCFFKKWQSAQPPATWLEGELSALRGAAARERANAQDREAKAFWETLTGTQKARLNAETLEMLNQDGGGEHFTQSSDEFAIKRRQLLLDADTRDWLTGLAAQTPQPVGALRAAATAHPEPVIADSDADELEDAEGADDEWEAAAAPPQQLNLEIYIGPILAEIRQGLLDLEDIDGRRATLLQDDEWEAVVSAIIARLAA